MPVKGKIIGLIVAAAATGLWAASASVRTPPIDGPAPNFQVETADGQKLSLADFKGQVLVLNFWATWCGPCKQELPLLDAYYRAQHDHGLRVLAITTEDSLPMNRLKELGKAMAIPMVRRFKGDYGPLKAVPTNYIIDRKGVLRYAKAAAFTLDDLNELLVPMLREPGESDAPGAWPG
jgi:thiol-disulfide isomerase/thioredoxin